MTYDECMIETCRTIIQQFYGKSFVLAGMYILAGFSDKLRLMNLLIDDIKTFREFNVRNCTACAFSCGGHLLAAVSGNVVSVFSSVNFRNTVRDCHFKAQNIKWVFW